MVQKSDFEETFTEYHDLIRKEIAKDTNLDIKVAKVEQLVFLMHSIVSDRFSQEYNDEAEKIKLILRKGSYFDEVTGKEVMVNYNQFATQRRRLDFLREWLSLMLQNHTPFKLYGNLNRVDFGD